MPHLRSFGESLYVADGAEVAFWGSAYPARMAVVKLGPRPATRQPGTRSGAPRTLGLHWFLYVLKTQYALQKRPPVNLVQWNKEERRKRILAAAERIIARDGVEGLTMRELAEASHVSTPTVYNLVGSKDEVLFALVQEIIDEALASSSALWTGAGGSVVARAFALCEAGVRVLLVAPDASRRLFHHVLTSREFEERLRTAHQRNLETITAIVRDGQRSGDLVDWVDAPYLARLAYDLYVAAVTRWANGDSDPSALRVDTTLSLAIAFLGVTQGAARVEVEALARQCDTPGDLRHEPDGTQRAASGQSADASNH